MKMEEFDYEELQAATESFSESQLIGKGSHGLIYKGILKESNKLVAFKKPSHGLQILGDNSKLENEISILSSLPENPYVITLLGVSHDSAMNKHLVMEYMPNGSLYDLLHAATSAPPTWPKRLEMAIQIAKAVQFLHDDQRNPTALIIHRDIKSDNILFDANWNAKLADFGLALKLENHRVDSRSRPAGTIGYLDPCYTTPCKLSTKNDVFSFGVVLLEIMSCRKAIDVSREPSSIVDWATELIKDDRTMEICDNTNNKHTLPTFMESSVRHLLCIAMRCVSSNENQRPSMDEVVMGMMENCLTQRVRFLPIWMSLLRWRKSTARRQSKAAKCVLAKQVDVLHLQSNFSSGKVLLIKDILADPCC